MPCTAHMPCTQALCRSARDGLVINTGSHPRLTPAHAARAALSATHHESPLPSARLRSCQLLSQHQGPPHLHLTAEQQLQQRHKPPHAAHALNIAACDRWPAQQRPPTTGLCALQAPSGAAQACLWPAWARSRAAASRPSQTLHGTPWRSSSHVSCLPLLLW